MKLAQFLLDSRSQLERVSSRTPSNVEDDALVSVRPNHCRLGREPLGHRAKVSDPNGRQVRSGDDGIGDLFRRLKGTGHHSQRQLVKVGEPGHGLDLILLSEALRDLGDTEVCSGQAARREEHVQLGNVARLNRHQPHAGKPGERWTERVLGQQVELSRGVRPLDVEREDRKAAGQHAHRGDFGAGRESRARLGRPGKNLRMQAGHVCIGRKIQGQFCSTPHRPTSNAHHAGDGREDLL